MFTPTDVFNNTNCIYFCSLKIFPKIILTSLFFVIKYLMLCTHAFLSSYTYLPIWKTFWWLHIVHSHTFWQKKDSVKQNIYELLESSIAMKPMHVLFESAQAKCEQKDKENMNTEHYWGVFSLKMKTKITCLKRCGEKQIKSKELQFVFWILWWNDFYLLKFWTCRQNFSQKHVSRQGKFLPDVILVEKLGLMNQGMKMK